MISKIRNEGELSPSVFQSKTITDIPPKRIETILEKETEIKRSGIGSIMEGSSPYSQEDDTILTDEKRQGLRELLRENPLAYIFCMDTPREALYSPKPYPIVKQEWHESDDGVNAVTEWRRLFEAREGQASLEELSIWTAFYNRLFGEFLAEKRYLNHPYLHLLGYNQNRMIGRIEMISPLLLKDVHYSRTTGKVNQLDIYGRDGQLKEFKGNDLNRFIYSHNMPSNEFRGLPRLQTSKRWLEGFDDLLELILDIYYNDARPLEHHMINEEGLLHDDVTLMWNEHEDRVKDTIAKQKRALMTNERIKIALLGSQGRVLESSAIIDKTKEYNMQALQRPDAFTTGRNTNKATIDEQKTHFQQAQLQAIDRAVAQKMLYRFVFPDVLRTRNITIMLSPTVSFPEFAPSNALEEAITDQTQVDTFGEERMVQIAERKGYKYTREAQLEKKKRSDPTLRDRVFDDNRRGK